jgi:hypothetical protein
MSDATVVVVCAVIDLMVFLTALYLKRIARARRGGLTAMILPALMFFFLAMGLVGRPTITRPQLLWTIAGSALLVTGFPVIYWEDQRARAKERQRAAPRSDKHAP